MTIETETTKAVIRVGEGRGFIVEAGHKRLIITASHCLPHFPPSASMSFEHERTYAALLGSLADSELRVWAECVFADPVGDIAVLGGPDNPDPDLWNEAMAYEALTESVPSLRVGGLSLPRDTETPAWLLQLDGRWTRCTVRHFGGSLQIENAREGIHGGMSGSPILTDDATAIGVVCCAGGENELKTGGVENPRLSRSLPGWLLQQLGFD